LLPCGNKEQNYCSLGFLLRVHSVELSRRLGGAEKQMKGRLMRGFWATAALAGAAGFVGATAFAADLPVSRPTLPYKAPAQVAMSWTGWYAGLTAGYSFGTSDPSLTINTVEAGVAAGFNPIPSRYSVDGFIGGAEVGYNYQFNNYLVGLETDFSYASGRGSASATGPFFIGGTLMTTYATKLEWLGTVRARLGVLATDNLLVYGTGGFAYGDVSTATIGSNVAPGAAPCSGPGLTIYCAQGSTSGVSTGWTLGAGVQYALSQQWLLKAEYLYVDLGHQTVTFPDRDVVGGTLTATTSFTTNIVRGGADFRF
jgi:outer membrane immunogenic protein